MATSDSDILRELARLIREGGGDIPTTTRTTRTSVSDRSEFTAGISPDLEGLERAEAILAAMEAHATTLSTTGSGRLGEVTIEIEKQKELIKKIKEEKYEDALGKLFPEITNKAKSWKRSVTDLQKSISFLGSQMKDASGNLTALGKGFSWVGDKMAALTKIPLQAWLPVAAIGLAAKAFWDMAVAIDNTSKSLGASTGAGDIYADSIKRIKKNSRGLNVSFEEIGEGIQGLSDGLSSFNPYAEATNEYLAETTVKLKKLGVATSTSVKTIDMLQRSMGMTAEAAADATAQIARMGKEIGISGTKALNDFNAASGRLANFGSNNVKVFKELSATAKATGLEMGTLLGISEKFDKFDTAADAIGQLNAVLGTNISTLEMMNMTDSQRVANLREQVKATVGNFDSLDQHTKMMIANQLGVKDVAEAQKLLNMSTAEYNDLLSGQQEEADIQKEMAETTAELVKITDRWKMALEDLLISLSPIIDMMMSIVTTIGPYIGDFFIGTIVALGGAMAWFAVTSWSAAAALTAIGWTAAVIAVTALVTGLGWLIKKLFGLHEEFHRPGSPPLWLMPLSFAENFESLTDSVKEAWKFVKSFATGGLSLLYDAFHWSGSPDLWELPAEFADNIVRIADAIKTTMSSVGGFADTLIKMSSINFKGFVALRADGASTSMIMGSEDVITSLNKGQLTVDVKMPEIKMPNIEVKVFIGDRELREIIRTEAKAIVGGAG